MRVFIDACVILSRIPREMVFSLAKFGHIDLFYSQSVEKETRYVAERNGLIADIAASFISLRLINAPVIGEARDDLWLPDEGDLHVLEGAITANAEVLLTENLRDFPRAALDPFAIKAISPDQLFYKVFDEHPSAFDGLKSYSQNQLKNAKLYKTAKRFRQ